MKTIIAGSRDIIDYETVKAVIAEAQAAGFVITEVVSGRADGVDTLGERWAEENNIPIKKFPADWSIGKSAGAVRNNKMAKYADQLILIYDGESRGSTHMLACAVAKKMKIFKSIYKKDEL